MTDLPEMPATLDALGVSWFREQDWPRWCAIDPDFQPDYQHWLKRSEEMVRHYEAAGKVVLKITVDPDEFLTWTRATGSGVGSEARASYVGIKTMHKRTAN